ncbi:MAG: LysR substrate-binding domain-containing protein [Burkholderiaceae bacterium]
MKLPPFAALRAFEAVARLGSVTRAAAELHLTPGAVSHQLRSLEDYFGRALLTRAGRRLVLTEDGRNYAAAARRGIEQIAWATDQLNRRPAAGELAISVLPSFADRWLLPRLADCDREVRARLRIGTSLAIADFADDGYDCAIRMGGGRWQDVGCEPLFGDAYVPVCSPRLDDAYLPRTAADFERMPLLRAVAEPWAPWFALAGVRRPEPTEGLAFTDSHLLLEAAAAGYGVALARLSLAGPALHARELVAPLFLPLPSPQAYFLVWPARTESMPIFIRFRDWLRARVAEFLATDSQARWLAPPNGGSMRHP